MCCMSESVKLKFHLVMSSIGFIGGIAGCLVFYIVYSNFHAGTWSLLAGLMAVICFQFHVFYRFDTLDSHYNEKHLYYFRNLGIFMFLMALIAIISYLVISATLGIPMLPVETSLILASVQAFLTLKWSISVYYFSGFYSSKLQTAYTVA
uniref:Putative LOC100867995 [Apis florea] n=1 Tax=Lepeophtheirus salmonis TaxID=72036 RepID=A0A0K2U335_LEPSM